MSYGKTARWISRTSTMVLMPSSSASDSTSSKARSRGADLHGEHLASGCTGDTEMRRVEEYLDPNTRCG